MQILFLEGLMKTTKYLSQDNQYRAQDLNLVSPKCESRALLTRQPLAWFDI
jgi:hypothetical protein